MNVEEAKKEVAKCLWFHEMNLGDGIITRGKKSLALLEKEAGILFKHSIENKTFLDVGAWDGFFSFEAKRRGARRVLATDSYCWTGNCKDMPFADRFRDNKRSFDLAKSLLGLDIEEQIIDAWDVCEETVGRFDVVLFSGVFYHLKNPFYVLQNLADLCDDCLILETHACSIGEDAGVPAMRFYPNAELANDGSNWWGPNVKCVEEMLRACGFSRIEMAYSVPASTVLDNLDSGKAFTNSRAIFHAFKK